jgi:conjugative transfer signal peptidase TraF
VAAAAGWRVNLTPSLPIGIYRVVQEPTQTTLTRHTLVIACLPPAVAKQARIRGYLARGSCPGNALPVGKPVLALSGDTVQFTATGIVLHGQTIPASAPLTQDTHGRRLVPYPFGTVILLPTMMVLLASMTRSYDSRYWGPMPITQVRAIVTPLWTWPRTPAAGTPTANHPDRTRPDATR